MPTADYYCPVCNSPYTDAAQHQHMSVPRMAPPPLRARAYRYTEPAFGDFIVSGNGRMFGSEYAVALEAVLTALAGDFIVIPKADLPAVVDGKLVGLRTEHGGLPQDDMERAKFYRQEAVSKLALAENASLTADKKARTAIALAKDLEANLRHSDMAAFAKDLVNLGWSKPAAN